MGYASENLPNPLPAAFDSVARLTQIFEGLSFVVKEPETQGGKIKLRVEDPDSGRFIDMDIESTFELADGYWPTGNKVYGWYKDGEGGGRMPTLRNLPSRQEITEPVAIHSNDPEARTAEIVISDLMGGFSPETHAQLNIDMQGEEEDNTDIVAADIVVYLRTGAYPAPKPPG